MCKKYICIIISMNTYHEYILSTCWFRAIILTIQSSEFMIVIDSYVFSVFPWEHDSSHKVRINAKYAKAKHILLIFWGYDWSALDLGYCSARKYDVDLSCCVSNLGLVESRDRWWWYVPSCCLQQNEILWGLNGIRVHTSTSSQFIINSSWLMASSFVC